MSDPSYVLVLGASADGQLVGVLDCLKKRNVPCVFLDADTVRDVRFSVGENGRSSLSVDGRALSRPALVWTRIKIGTLLGQAGPEVADEYIKRNEWAGFLSELAYHYEEEQIYQPRHARRADCKMFQFPLAAKAGFSIPNTAYFVGEQHARDFIRAYPRSVAKPIQARSVPAQAGSIDTYINLPTMPVDADTISQADDGEFSHCPQFFQERIAEGVEYRTFGFRDRIFSYRYRTRVEDRYLPDERVLFGGEYRGVSLYGAQFVAVDPPQGLGEAVREFLERSDLEYAAFDTIETSDGRHVFLECNPEGQWYAAAATGTLQDVCDHFAVIVEQKLSRKIGTGAVDTVATVA